jgi:hypothetical protein
MNLFFAAEPVLPPSWTWGGVLIAVVVVAACLAVVYVALRAYGISVPPWVAQIGWILVVAVVAVLAIRFLLSL